MFGLMQKLGLGATSTNEASERSKEEREPARGDAAAFLALLNAMRPVPEPDVGKQDSLAPPVDLTKNPAGRKIQALTAGESGPSARKASKQGKALPDSSQPQTAASSSSDTLAAPAQVSDTSNKDLVSAKNNKDLVTAKASVAPSTRFVDTKAHLGSDLQAAQSATLKPRSTSGMPKEPTANASGSPSPTPTPSIVDAYRPKLDARKIQNTGNSQVPQAASPIQVTEPMVGAQASFALDAPKPESSPAKALGRPSPGDAKHARSVATVAPQALLQPPSLQAKLRPGTAKPQNPAASSPVLVSVREAKIPHLAAVLDRGQTDNALSDGTPLERPKLLKEQSKIQAPVASLIQTQNAPQSTARPRETKDHWSIGSGPKVRGLARVRTREAGSKAHARLDPVKAVPTMRSPAIACVSCDESIQGPSAPEKSAPKDSLAAAAPASAAPSQDPNVATSLPQSTSSQTGTTTSAPAPAAPSATPLPTEHLVQTLRQAMEVKSTPHDLRWVDPEFGELALRIERHGDELEVSIRSALSQTHETLKQHHGSIADELTLDPEKLRFESPDAQGSDTPKEQSDPSPLFQQDPQKKPRAAASSPVPVKAPSPSQPSPRPLTPSGQGLDLIA